MSKIKELIEFLRLDRRYDEDKEKNKEIDQTKVNIEGIYSNLKRTVERTEFEKFNLYERIFNILDQHEATHFYVLPLSNKNVFYIKLPPTADGYNYLNIETKKSEPVEDETQLLPIEINESTYHYFYDKEQREVVLSYENLKDTAVFYDSIFFDPEKMNLQTATYEYQYSKPLSSYYKFIDSVLTLLKRIVSFLIFKDTSLKNVEVEVKKKGTIFLIPSIFIADRKNYYVYYYYTSSSKKMFYQINDEDIAIKLKFKGKEPFLSYLNETIFTQQSFDFSDAYNKQRRIDFITSFKEEIIFPLERQMLNGSISDFREAMITLFYLTDDVAFTISNECLWRLFEQIVDRDNLVNSSALPEENLFIKLLDIIAKKETNEKLFLYRLLQIKDDKITYLELLFNGLNGENNTHFVNLVYSIWKKTDYIQIDPDKNKLITENSPLMLDYRSDKTLGFHHDNAAIEWNQKTKAIDVKVTVGTGVFKETKHYARHGYYTTNDEIQETLEYNYHPFSPLVILNADNPKFLIKDDEQEGEQIQLLPAFVLYAHGESAFWKNWLTAGEYAVDVLTTISGVGNILKFGRLYKVLQAGNRLAGKTRTFTKVVTTVKGVAGVAEISSGSVNILLKLTGVADTELGREISKYLFYFEMFALSGEVSIALYTKVQKSAAKILAKERVLREAAKKEGIEDVDDFIKELRRVSNFDNIAKNLDSIRLTKLELDEWIKIIRELGGEVKYYTSSKKMMKYFKEQKCGACFDPWEVPPIVWIRKDATALEMFHESMHFEDFLRRGKANYIRGEARQILKVGKQTQIPFRDQLISTYIKEKYVLDKILEEQANWIQKYGKGRFTDQEIEFSKTYFKEDVLDRCIKNGIDINNITIKP
ncbi:hypothetical protein [Flavobacterium sp.]|uniref:hypothetical protein n=1 Tax=Flavobacterium sp. TaxID=239 RepID=UPI002B4AEE83|nr:hypothetical protein [Flavobacterium sp.]HLP63268.1 hypothetical protein [Flavobacterium sp.]